MVSLLNTGFVHFNDLNRNLLVKHCVHTLDFCFTNMLVLEHVFRLVHRLSLVKQKHTTLCVYKYKVCIFRIGFVI